ncbi:MAG: T9SS type A sorting domain-containing protein [Bacteroidota bacterium]
MMFYKWHGIIFFLFYMAINTRGQNCDAIEFYYDASGNRIKRQHIQVFPCYSSRFSQETSQNKDSIIHSDISFLAEVYPNPTRSDVVIKITDTNVKPEDIKEILWIDNTGRVLQKMETKEVESVWNVASYPAGNYFLIVICNNKKRAFQIIKTE